MEARNLLSVTLNGLTTFKCIDQYQPSACEPQASPAEEPMQMEAWLTPRYGDLDAAVRPPQWYVPSTAEVSGPLQVMETVYCTALCTPYICMICAERQVDFVLEVELKQKHSDLKGYLQGLLGICLNILCNLVDLATGPKVSCMLKMYTNREAALLSCFGARSACALVCSNSNSKCMASSARWPLLRSCFNSILSALQKSSSP